MINWKDRKFIRVKTDGGNCMHVRVTEVCPRSNTINGFVVTIAATFPVKWNIRGFYNGGADLFSDSVRTILKANGVIIDNEEIKSIYKQLSIRNWVKSCDKSGGVGEVAILAGIRRGPLTERR